MREPLVGCAVSIMHYDDIPHYHLNGPRTDCQLSGALEQELTTWRAAFLLNKLIADLISA